MSTEATFHYEGRDLEALGNLPNYYSWIIGTFAPYVQGRVVEYGAGAGSVSNRLLPLSERLDLVEPSPNLIAGLTDRFKDQPKVHVHNMMLEDHVAGLEDNVFDAVVMVNVLEHVEKDTEAVKELARVLKPGGHLCVFLPALSWLYSELDKLVGHYRRYEKKPLVDLAEAAELTVLKATYFDALGVLPWWLINTLGRKTDFDPRMAELYDSVGVPVTKAFEGLIRPPLGKNILLVAQKP